MPDRREAPKDKSWILPESFQETALTLSRDLGRIALYFPSGWLSEPVSSVVSELRIRYEPCGMPAKTIFPADQLERG
jgi:hypothetical protein